MSLLNRVILGSLKSFHCHNPKMETTNKTYRSNLSRRNEEAARRAESSPIGHPEETTPTTAFTSKLKKKRDSLGIGLSSVTSVSPELSTKIQDLKLWQLNCKVAGVVLSKTEIENFSGGKKFLFVLYDETPIRVVIYAHPNFDSLYDKLQVGNGYIISKIDIRPTPVSQRGYTWVPNAMTISFNKGSTIEKLDSNQLARIPTRPFIFKTFECPGDTGEIIDLFGALYEIGDPIKINSSKGSMKREIVLINNEDKLARATIWGNTAEAFFKKVKGLEDVIVALGAVRVSTFARVSNDLHIDIFDDSIILVDPPFPECETMRAWLGQQ